MHDFVRVGVGGMDDSSRTGITSVSHSQDFSQDLEGMVVRFSHMNMFRLLVEDRRSMFYGELLKLIDMNIKWVRQHAMQPEIAKHNIERVREHAMQPDVAKQLLFSSTVVFLGTGASYVNRSDQHQHNNDDDKRNNSDVFVLNDGFGGVGNGGNHGLGVDGECMSDRGLSREVSGSHFQIQ